MSRIRETDIERELARPNERARKRYRERESQKRRCPTEREGRMQYVDTAPEMLKHDNG